MEEIKQLYQGKANLIDNWRKKSRTELCNLYLDYAENKDDRKEAAMAALISKFIPVVKNTYQAQGKKVANITDCYDIIIDSIIYVLDKQPWKDENSSLFGVKNAPEIAIMKRIDSLMNNFWVAQTRDKRSANQKCFSLDAALNMKDDEGNSIVNYEVMRELSTEDDHIHDFSTRIRELIREYFNNKQYEYGFILDIILNLPVFDSLNDDESSDKCVFNFKRTKHYLKSMTENYAKVFALEYNIPEEVVLRARKYMINADYEALDSSLNRALLEWRHSKEIIKLLTND